MIFCIDTSSIITAWKVTYPPETFKTLWSNIEVAIKNKTIIAPDEVYKEIKQQDDSILEWVKSNKELFVRLSPKMQEIVTEVLKEYPNLIDYKNSNPQADPFIIALAKIQKAIVITEENTKDKLNKTKIPSVCLKMNIEFTNFLGMIQKFKWKF